VTPSLLLAAWLAAADAGAPDGAAPPVAPTVTSEPGAAVAVGSSVNKAAARTDHAQALARLRAGRVGEAAELFARAVARDPNNAAFATDLGFALGKLGRRAQAEAILRGAIEKEPRRFYAYVNLADLLADDPARWERREAIVTFLDKGLELLKDDRKGRFNLLLRVANFERAVGRTSAARARLAPLLATGAGTEPALTTAQRKRVLDLQDLITLDERAHALEAWPAPAVSAGDRALADDGARALAAGRVDEARAAIEPLVRKYPSWQRSRFLLGRALESLGRVDEAARELEIAVNLAPSDAEAWRALGRLLALNGGALEAERADEALRNALTLEPAWSDLRELRTQLARRRAALTAPPPTPRGGGPSEHARALFQEAEEWIEVGDPAGMGRDLVEQALTDSPGYVAAAVTGYSLSGTVPEATVAALWDDGPGLWALLTGVRSLGKERTADTLTRPWVDRAVALDVQEARFARAVARAAADDRAGALDDLVAYVSREPQPAHLFEARALRAGLTGQPGADGRPSPELTARIRLLEDRPDAALRALGGACTAGLPPDRLVALGLVHEYADRRGAARACYEQAAAKVPDDRGVLTRLSRLDARLEDGDLVAADRKPLMRAAAREIAAAEWALARLDAASGDPTQALDRVDRALSLATAQPSATDVWIAAARRARAGWATAGQARLRAASDRRRRFTIGGGIAGALLLFLLMRWRFGGWTLTGALRRQPELFPEVARAVGELRHDVLKHRAGVLGLVADANVNRADLARALHEPKPTSAVVADAHDRLTQAARGQGLILRPLRREPVLGALAADLARAEKLLGASAPLDVARLLAIDGRLRGSHAERLTALLQQGPRTRLGAAELSGWIAALQAATRSEGARWIAPALMLGDLDVDFPVERAALHSIFANLLRNAQAAAGAGAGAGSGQGQGQGHADVGHVIVRVERERDATGRQLASLLIGDSSPAPLTLETIEARASGRGLAIVRDLVRQWRGHLVIRAEGAPFQKVVGACFPL
jgi:tetratricopeptide (TPR) repeat protein